MRTECTKANWFTFILDLVSVPASLFAAWRLNPVFGQALQPEQRSAKVVEWRLQASSQSRASHDPQTVSVSVFWKTHKILVGVLGVCVPLLFMSREALSLWPACLFNLRKVIGQNSVRGEDLLEASPLATGCVGFFRSDSGGCGFILMARSRDFPPLVERILSLVFNEINDTVEYPCELPCAWLDLIKSAFPLFGFENLVPSVCRIF